MVHPLFPRTHPLLVIALNPQMASETIVVRLVPLYLLLSDTRWLMHRQKFDVILGHC